MWGVAGGIVGARLYHVVTSWNEVPDPKLQGIFEIWKGGSRSLGRDRGRAARGRDRGQTGGQERRDFADYVAPGLLLAQGIGRFGNYFNQELFGGPTDLPWGLEIDPANRPGEHLDAETFHPIFLYEFIWDMIGVGLLLWVDRRFRIRPPGLFCLYVAWYTFARATWQEQLRVDPSHEIAGMRLNFWVATILFVVGRRRVRLDAATRAGAGRAASGAAASIAAVVTVPVRDLELDLDAFEGPFDLLLTLVLKEELELVDVEIAAIVVAFVERQGDRRRPSVTDDGTVVERELDLEACGEFLVLVAALLELKTRELFGEESGLEDLDAEEAAEELAERLAAYRRFKAAAAWLEGRLDEESDRYFRIGPAPLAPEPVRELPREEPARLAEMIRLLAVPPPEPSLRHLVLTYPPVSLFLDRFRAVLARRRRFDFDEETRELGRIEQMVAFLALLELRRSGEITLGQSAPFQPISVWRAAEADAVASLSAS